MERVDGVVEFKSRLGRCFDFLERRNSHIKVAVRVVTCLFLESLRRSPSWLVFDIRESTDFFFFSSFGEFHFLDGRRWRELYIKLEFNKHTVTVLLRTFRIYLSLIFIFPHSECLDYLRSGETHVDRFHILQLDLISTANSRWWKFVMSRKFEIFMKVFKLHRIFWNFFLLLIGLFSPENDQLQKSDD